MYITKKRIKGHTYHYAVIGKRVDGKPRIVWQKYLGKVEDIVARADASATAPCEAGIFEFGASAALWQIAQRLNVVRIIDDHAPKRRQGATVGEYMLIAALYRALSPGPKTQVGEWFEKTVLRRFMPHLSGADLKSQRFWDHMDRLDRPHIQAIERDLTEHLVSEFNLDLVFRTLLPDPPLVFGHGLRSIAHIGVGPVIKAREFQELVHARIDVRRQPSSSCCAVAEFEDLNTTEDVENHAHCWAFGPTVPWNQKGSLAFFELLADPHFDIRSHNQSQEKQVGECFRPAR
jgi:hypothetical protein